jgi:hypothetical protein
MFSAEVSMASFLLTSGDGFESLKGTVISATAVIIGKGETITQKAQFAILSLMFIQTAYRTGRAVFGFGDLPHLQCMLAVGCRNVQFAAFPRF